MRRWYPISTLHRWLLAIAILCPGCPIPGSLRGIGTGEVAAAHEEPLYAYACDGHELVLRIEADSRAEAIDLCIAELRARVGSSTVTCTCRLEGNARIGRPAARGG